MRILLLYCFYEINQFFLLQILADIFNLIIKSLFILYSKAFIKRLELFFDHKMQKSLILLNHFFFEETFIK